MCTDANACGTTVNKPLTTETETQSCTYTPPASYHEKQDYLDYIAGGTTTITVGQTLQWNVNADATTMYLFSLEPGKTYEVSVIVTSGAGLGFLMQQRYGPPQLTYVDGAPGYSQFSGGPTMVNGDVQRIAIQVGPASIASGGNISVVEV
jgi:hypothetical protein